MDLVRVAGAACRRRR
ncbi:hypothetical protein ACFYU5_34095 [Nocardia aobensis]|uniref:Uncharacterized protein n=1 Tax=Nocardia aobensis TaxID=257277 RepID=A0ABW6PEE1_9NOCA